MNKNLKILGSPNGSFVVHRVHEYVRYMPHAHWFYEIDYFARGQGIMQFNGKEFKLRGPQLHFCPPKPAWHSYDTTGQPLATASMAVYPELFFGTASTDGSSNPKAAMQSLKKLCQLEVPLISLTPNAAIIVETLVERMCDEYRLGLPGHMLTIGSCIQELLVLAMRQQEGINVYTAPIGKNAKAYASNTKTYQPNLTRRDPRIDKALQIMQDNLQNPVSNLHIAGQVGFKEKYFIRLFKTEVGTSPQRYYMHLRLEAAAQYLIHSPLKIEQVAHLYGFKRRSHFHAAFQRFFKTTPSLYRYIHQGK